MFGTLSSAEYSDSGNSLGNLYMVEALRDDGGSMMVRVRESAVHSDPIVAREYRAPEDLFDRISDIVDRAGMKEWGELPPSEFIAYDASTPSIRLTYKSDDPDELLPEYLRYSFNDALPDGGKGAIHEIRDLMTSYAVEDNLIREYTEQDRR